MSEAVATEEADTKPSRRTRPRPTAMVSIEPLCVDLATAAAMISVGESTIQKMQARGEFPMPRQLSPRRCGYLVSELKEWLANRPESSMIPPPASPD